MKKTMRLIPILLLLTLAGCGGEAAAASVIEAVDSVVSSDPTQVVETAADLSEQDSDEPEVDEDEIERDENWSEETHSKEAYPDYETVFPQELVNEITIVISPDQWAVEMASMTEIYGEQGSGDAMAGGGDFPGGDRQAAAPAEGGRPARNPGDAGAPADAPGGGDRAMMGGGGAMNAASENPEWVEATILFNGETWENVGFRLKGNSSLKNTWSKGDDKYPFKLDFDEFEDSYVEITNQRFYGFKQLTFSSAFGDNSYLHEKVAADLFREAGVAAAETAFYAVYLDTGNGPEYIGLYTAVEVIDDTVIETQFEDDDGNVYKPEGSGSTFAAGSFNEASFDKETNQEENDYSDILAVYEALHSSLRLSDAAAWRAQLESVFDVDAFLNWLAVNTTIQNWDTYGVMTHNYYLYTDPTTELVTWIPWDNNEALSSGGGGQMKNPLALDMSDVNSEQWPLIGYLMADEVYADLYQSYLEAFITDVFVLEEMADTYTEWHDLIAPYVEMEIGSDSPAELNQFATSVQTLITHTNSRINAVETYLTMN